MAHEIYAVNVARFVALEGAAHHVETHLVEHGLLMLGGGGVNRLDEDWFWASRAMM
ncbi:MAG: hypothetical protein ACSHXI_20735 [Hoeflea sp.]|uniref:hypothetical protein n=1 Tax=Hoeflea sp. TaxID=1940281 RepID=UPI003EF6C3EE